MSAKRRTAPKGIPGIGETMGQSGGDVGEHSGGLPGVQQVMGQGGPTPSAGTIDSVQRTMGQGGASVGKGR